jgi:hypothetical protein
VAYRGWFGSTTYRMLAATIKIAVGGM